MANLTLTIGALSASVTADNAKASSLLTQYAAAIGAEGTNQEKADAVVRALVKHMQEQARRQRSNTATVEALAEIEAEIAVLVWE